MPDKKTIKNAMEKLELKSKEYLQRLNIFKENAADAYDKADKFDTTIISSNEDYMIKLQEGNREEFEILKENMAKAQSEEERESIRLRMKEIQEEMYKKDSENKEFYERQQEAHNKKFMKYLGVMAVTAGLVKYHKPIIDKGKKVIMKKISG